MQERLQEIEGTLARSKERRNTILYKLAKRRRDAERLARLGVSTLPRNPLDVTEPAVARHVLFQIKQELGDKVARLNNAARCSVAKDGEEAVRALNDEANRQLARRVQWQARLAALQGEQPSEVSSTCKQFFGAAKDLPEASRQQRRRQRANGQAEEQSPKDEQEEATVQDSESSEVNEKDSGKTLGESRCSAYMRYIAMLREQDEALRQVERSSEEKVTQRSEAMQRAKEKSREADKSSMPHSHLILSFVEKGTLQLPTEDEYRQRMVYERKEALQARLREMKRTL